MQKILIIEDDDTILRLIASTLTQNGYECTCAHDGKQGANLFETGYYDMVLLDLMLPKISGYELLEYFRISNVPIIIISAMDKVNDKIRGLKMGADDYLAKPFQIGELLARVESVLRRSGKGNGKIAIGDVSIDIDARQVWKNENEVELTTKEFDLLVMLVRNRNVALSRCALYEAVWEEEYTGETRTLDNHIQKLRKKLDWQDKIQTVFRIGYRFKE